MDYLATEIGTARTKRHRPLVGVLANALLDGKLVTQSVDEKYLEALTSVAEVVAIIIPALGLKNTDTEDILGSLDGVMLTGAVSNVHPRHFSATADEERHSPFDPARDQSAFKLIHHALKRDMPLLAICRGMQELNVSHGGSLVAEIQEDSGRFCHDAWDKNGALQQLYAATHAVDIKAGGLLARILGTEPVRVNSLHVQAVDRMGDGLVLEGQAEDGTIEAVSVASKRFALGVQWHPEFMAADNDVSRRIFRAFGAAVRVFHADRPSIERSKS